MASIRRNKTAAGERRWQVRWRDGHARDRCSTFSREGDAKRFRVDLERKQQLGPLYQARPEFFGDFQRAWFERYAQRVRPSTLARAQETSRHLRDFAPFYVQQISAGE